MKVKTFVWKSPEYVEVSAVDVDEFDTSTTDAITDKTLVIDKVVVTREWAHVYTTRKSDEDTSKGT